MVPILRGAHKRGSCERCRIGMAQMTNGYWRGARAAAYDETAARTSPKGKDMVRFARVRRDRLSGFSRLAQSIALAAMVALLPFAALAQSADQYPNRPVKMLIPYAPGGATDIIARHVSPKLQETLGQPFVVDNRPGASGNIALEAAA